MNSQMAGWLNGWLESFENFDFGLLDLFGIQILEFRI